MEKFEKYLQEFKRVAKDWFSDKDFINIQYTFFQEFFKKENLEKLDWPHIQKMGDHIHSFKSMALARKKALGKANHPIDHYRDSFYYLAYGQDNDEERIHNFMFNNDYKIRNFGESVNSEIIGNLFADKYVLYNRRDKYALEFLDIKLDFKRGDDFSKKFIKFNKTIELLIKKYIEIVGEQTKNPINLEIDQFFSYIYETHKKKEETNYWIFQANPSVWKIEEALNNNEVGTWSVSAHKKKIGLGDKFILYVTGKNSGIYGTGEVISDVYEDRDTDDVAEYSMNPDKNPITSRVDIKIENNWVDNYINRDELNDFPKLIKLKVGKQGTNFSATKEEYEEILKIKNNLAYPFNKLFKDFDDANWAFDLIKMTLGQLGINDEENEMISLTYNKQAQRIILDYGSWAILGFYSLSYKYKFMVTLVEDNFKHDIEHKKWGAFAKTEPGISGYELVESGKELIKRDLSKSHKDSLKYAVGFFKKWNKSNLRRHNQEKLVKAVFNKDYRIELLKNGLTEEDMAKDEIANNINIKYPLNQILYGPPGTGKTYHTVNEALKIIDPEFYYENKNNREKLIRKFKEYKDKELIEFVTFHQSFYYEDFIEGIKPILENNEEKENRRIGYKIEDGVFKSISNAAGSNLEQKVSKYEFDQKKINFWKMSLGNTLGNEESIYNHCIENNYISLGWGGDINYTQINEKDYSMFKEAFLDLNRKNETEIESSYSIQSIYAFKIWMKKGDMVFVSNGNRKIRAIGIVEDKYEYLDNFDSKHHHFRKVKWLLKNVDIPVKSINEKYFSQQTIYNLNLNGIRMDALRELFGEKKDIEKKYVLIIDEINRGNIAQIFGELITLVEKDKRIGNSEELKTVLPYSKEEFGVPKNLYIIGTMNTADRSIESLDTALRRRFSFIEMPPISELVTTDGNLKETDGKLVIQNHEINLKNILDIINHRIEILIDRDHLIGHSYFMTVEDLDSLKEAFSKQIIPLLQEYFFGDFGKISLVLGEGFCKGNKVGNVSDIFASVTDYETDTFSEKIIYEIFDPLKMQDKDFIKAIQILLKVSEPIQDSGI